MYWLLYTTIVCVFKIVFIIAERFVYSDTHFIIVIASQYTRDE